jgi:hypothetical protein
MSGSERNGYQPSATVQELREQIARDRQELTETVTAIQAKTDVKERAREKIADAEIAASKLTSQVGHAVSAAADRVRDTVPRPVVTQAERVGGFVRREAKLVLAVPAAVLAAAVGVAGVAASAALRRHRNSSRHHRRGVCRR